MKCPACKTENKDGAKFCAKCGGSLSVAASPAEASRACPGCGHACKTDAKFCPKCGYNFVATAATAASTSAAMEPCPHCTAPVKKGAKFCGKCGKAIVRDQAEPVAQVGAISQPVSKKPAIAAQPIAPVTATPAAKQPAVQKTFATLSSSDTAPKKPDEPRSTVTSSSMPSAGDAPRKKNTPMAAIAGGVAVVAVALGVGGYFFFNKSHDAGVAPNEEKVATVSPSVPAPAAESIQTATAVTPTVPAPDVPPPVQSVPAATAPPVTATPPPVALRQESAGNQADALAMAINASLEEGNRCMGRKKYDCAISSANTVLRLDAHNSRALDMKRKAKAAQDKAISQIEIQ